MQFNDCGMNSLGQSEAASKEFIKCQLASAYLFSELDDEALDLVLQKAKIVYKAKGGMLSGAGDYQTGVYFILKGIVKVEGVSSSGEVSFLSLQKERDAIGVMETVANDKLVHGSITCFTDSALLYLDSKLFLRLMEEHPKFSLKVSRQLSHRLSHMMKAYTELATKDVASRLISALEFLGLSYGEPGGERVSIDLPITQNDLAHLINATRQTTNKYLKQFERHGIIELNSGQGRLSVCLDKLKDFNIEQI